MDKLNSEKFGKRIIALRESYGKSQEEICSELGVTQQTLSRYEKGQRQASLDFVARAAQYFNVSADYLLGLSRAAAPDNFVQEVVNRYGITESSLKTLERLNAPLDFGEEEKAKQMETNKQILCILNDMLTLSTGREWKTYGIQILNAIYNYCKGEYEDTEIKRNDLAGIAYYKISADAQRDTELYTLNNILIEMRKAIKSEEIEDRLAYKLP